MRAVRARVHLNGALVFEGLVRADMPFTVSAFETDGVNADAELGIAWLTDEERRERADEIEELRRTPREALGLPPRKAQKPGELHLALLVATPEPEEPRVLRFRSGDRLRLWLDAQGASPGHPV